MNVSCDHQFEALFTERQVAIWLGISVASLQRMRSNGNGPAFVQLSTRRIGYRRPTIEAWLAAHTITRVGGIEIRPTAPNQRPAAEHAAATVNKAVAPTATSSKEADEKIESFERSASV